MGINLERKEYQPLARPEVLLVLPPLYQTGREPDYNPKEPMGLMYLAASLRSRGRKAEIFDADVEAKTPQQVVQRILEKNPPLVGFSVLQRALPSLEIIVNALREKGYSGHITCGGITATLSFPYILERLGSKIDSVVLGEGENTVIRLAEKVLTGQEWRDVPGIAYLHNRAQVINKPIDSVDLDALPFAVRDYLEYCLGKTNYATIMGSRGCYGICTFCSNYSFGSLWEGPKWRGRNPKSVVDEMQEIFETHGVTIFKFNDPNIFGPGLLGREHVVRICQEIKRRRLPFHLMGFCRGNDITADPGVVRHLKDAGFERLLIGVESSDDKILQMFRKGETIRGMEQALDILEKEGISVVVGFMIFNPYTTMETLKKDLAFLKRRGLCPTLSKALRVFDGTPIQVLLEAEGRLIKRDPFEGYHEYIMPADVAAVYASMKSLFTNCLDRIRAVGQGRIWDIKKAPSFRDRQDFNNLAEAFFGVESFLLEELINWEETGDFNLDIVRETVKRVYEMLRGIGQAISVDIDEVVLPQEILSKEIYTLMKEKPWNTFREEYRWNLD
ncbi:MAG: B12-binding domain-containing radical SAM protein [Microgenomates group bacterium]